MNVGTASFMIGAQTIGAGLAAALTWTGSAWVAGASSPAKTMPVYTVAMLPTTGNSVGDVAYASQRPGLHLYGRSRGYGHANKRPAPAPGVECTWNGSVWQVCGTATTVMA